MRNSLCVLPSHTSRQCTANFAYVRVLRALSHVLALSASRLRCTFDGRDTCCGKHVTKMHSATRWLHAVRVRDVPHAGHEPRMYPEHSRNTLLWKCQVHGTLTESAGGLNCLIRRRHTNTFTPCLYICCVCSCVKTGLNTLNVLDFQLSPCSDYCILSSSASEFYVPKFRNTLFRLRRWL